MKREKTPINKPCPVCGSLTLTHKMVVVLSNGKFYSGDWVECSKCGIQGPVKAWNKKRK